MPRTTIKRSISKKANLSLYLDGKQQATYFTLTFRVSAKNLSGGRIINLSDLDFVVDEIIKKYDLTKVNYGTIESACDLLYTELSSRLFDTLSTIKFMFQVRSLYLLLETADYETDIIVNF